MLLYSAGDDGNETELPLPKPSTVQDRPNVVQGSIPSTIDCSDQLPPATSSSPQPLPRPQVLTVHNNSSLKHCEVSSPCVCV